jgi:hypothetical protein
MDNESIALNALAILAVTCLILCLYHLYKWYVKRK